MAVDVGDWVTFYRGGKMVLTVVRYVRTMKRYPYEPCVLTDEGEVATAELLEVRKPHLAPTSGGDENRKGSKL